MTRAGAAVALLLWLAPAGAQQAPAQAESAAVRARLVEIQDDLVQLRFEEAVAAAEALLGEGQLDEAGRAEALILRTQAHVALGDLKAAEQGWREILALRPGYVPDESLTPAKAKERFERVRAETVGRWVPRADPPEARIVVDGRDAVRDDTGGIALLAGGHHARVEHPGFDPLEQEIMIEAGKDSQTELRLVPNARTVILRTDVDGVEVRVDGAVAGLTARPSDAEGAPAAAAAELSIPNLTLGEHLFELAKPCFSTERRKDLLAVDLLDREPKRYDVVRMKPARGRLVFRGGPPGAGVLVDGEPAGTLPAASAEVCPGERQVLVSHGGRRIWISAEPVSEDQERVVEVTPRPNVVLLGAGEWPAGFEAFSRMSRIALDEVPARIDFADPRAWSRLDLPRDADLVLATSQRGAKSEVYLYSPILGNAAAVAAPPDLSPPRWTRAAWGLFAADTRIGGRTVAVEVPRGGAAGKAGIVPGDRILAAGGIDIDGAASLRRVLALASAAAPLEVHWLRADGTKREGKLDAHSSPYLQTAPGEPAQAMLRAAWATVDGAAQPDAAAPALANLALLLSAFGRHDAAVETWKRVRWGEREGVGQPTADYHRALALLALGRTAEAKAALESAAASAATAFHDDGPAIAPAARDRLADLGAKEQRPALLTRSD